MCTKTTKTRVIEDSQAEEEDKGAAAMGHQGHVSHCSVPLLSPQAHTVVEIQRRSESARSGLTTRVAQAITVTTAMMASSAMQSSSPSSMHSEPEGVQTWGNVKDILGSMQTRAELAHHRSTLLSGARLHHTPATLVDRQNDGKDLDSNGIATTPADLSRDSRGLAKWSRTEEGTQGQIADCDCSATQKQSKHATESDSDSDSDDECYNKIKSHAASSGTGGGGIARMLATLREEQAARHCQFTLPNIHEARAENGVVSIGSAFCETPPRNSFS